MEQFTNILLQLDETRTVIADLENAMRSQEATPALTANVRSLYKRQRQLEDQFSQLTHENFLDVCIYRLFTNDGKRPSLSTVTRALGDFQSLFTVIYDALKNGPKERVSYTDEIASETSFEFGYSFTGSLGFVLTMPNERLLLKESDLDRAMRTIFEIVKASDQEQIKSFARSIGLAAIRKVYSWADDHINSSLNADIRWCRQKDIRSSVVVEIPELERLQSLIGQTSERETREITVEGVFIGGDLDSRYFHIVSEEAGDFKGKMIQNAESEVRPTLGGLYRAKIQKTEVTHYSTEKVDISYILLKLHKVK
jgi:hypothetical protein